MMTQDDGADGPDRDKGPDFWDAKFADKDYLYGTRPNAWVVDQAYRLNPASRVLCVADGEGRNGVWLAGQGHRVTSVDFSPRAIQKATALALQRGVALKTVCADLLTWDWPAEGFDAVVLAFFHLPASGRQRVLAGIGRTLRPGGVLIGEGFSIHQIGRPSGGPRDLALLYDPDVLADELAAAGLTATHMSVEDVDLAEGTGHNGAASVTRILAHRPDA